MDLVAIWPPARFSNALADYRSTFETRCDRGRKCQDGNADFFKPQCIRQMVKGLINIGTLNELCRAQQIKYCDSMEEIQPFIKQAASDEPRLHADSTKLGLLPLE